MKTLTSIIFFIIASPVFSEDARQLNAHEHGIGALNIAIEAPLVVMEFHAPGADIVGFEYAAKSDADLAAISAALKTLEAPLDLFVLPKAARCAVQAVLRRGRKCKIIVDITIGAFVRTDSHRGAMWGGKRSGCRKLCGRVNFSHALCRKDPAYERHKTVLSDQRRPFCPSLDESKVAAS